jgi:membrane fusion protein (multidrug efflux system)
VPGITFKARVDSIQYGTGSVFSLLPAQNATGNYIKVVQRVPVKLVFDDARVANYMLAPGMSVEPSIRISP